MGSLQLALLGYLLLPRHRAHPREVLADKFWGEHSHEKERWALNTALWRWKKALEPEGIPARTYLINTHSGEVSFNRESQYWLDGECFEQETNQLIAYPA
jgi:DNA-binding SARP family transcriptional activator